MLGRLQPSVWLLLVTLQSGVITTFMGVMRNANQLIVIMFLLGMTEIISLSEHLFVERVCGLHDYRVEL